MSVFLNAQLDYIFFFYGLAFILLASVCVSLTREPGRLLPWKWLGLFGLTHGVNEWLDMLAVNLGSSTAFTAARWAMMAISFLFLVEFGRAGLKNLGVRVPGRWVLLPLAILAGLGALAGQPGLNAATRYALGLIGGLASAYALLRAARTEAVRERDFSRRSLRIAALAMALYALAAGLVVPKATFPPALWLNHDWFFSTLGFPVQLVRGLLAIAIASGIWLFSQDQVRAATPESHPSRKRRPRPEFWLVLLLLVILGAGWVATESLGRRKTAELSSVLLTNTNLAAAAVDPERVKTLTSTLADVGRPDYERLKGQITLIRESDPYFHYAYLITLRGGKPVFAVDATPTGKPDYALPGLVYDAAPKGLLSAIQEGTGQVAGPYSDAWGTWMSGFAPVRDLQSGTILAALGIDMDYKAWTGAIAGARVPAIAVTFLLALMIIGFYLAQHSAGTSAQLVRDSLAWNNAILENSAVGIMALNGRAEISAANPRLLEMFDYGPGELNGCNVEMLNVSRESCERFGREFYRPMRAGEAVDTEYQMKRRDGTVFWCSISGRTLESSNSSKGSVWVVGDIDKRRQTEERLRAVLSSSSLGIALIDRDEIVLIWNPAMEKIFGWTAEEVLGHPWPAVPPDKSAESADLHRRMMRGENLGLLSVVRQRKDGLLVDLEFHFAPVFDSAGVLIGSMAMMRDIADEKRIQEQRKQTEDALATSERRFRDVSEAAGEFLWETDAEGTFTFLTDKVEEIEGYPPSVLLGHTAFEHMHTDDVDRAILEFQEAARAMAPFKIQQRTIARSGQVVWEEVNGLPILDDAGELIGWRGAALDISKRMKARAELEESESRFRGISTSAFDGIVMIDDQAKVTFWNEAAERMFGHTREDALGRDVHHLIAPADQHDAARTGFAGFRQTGQGAALSKTVEMRAVRKDGSTFPVELSVSPVNIHGTWHAASVIRDITARKQSEENLQKLALEAELANRAKGEFLANMSHEIRTPMNGVVGMTGLLLDTNLDPEQREYAETVRASADALLSIINDILDFSKLEAGKMELEMVDFDARTTMDEVSDLLAPRAAERGLEFICLVDPDVPAYVRGDPGRIRQILLNLTGNSLKFTSSGEVTIYASVDSQTDVEAVLRFIVADTGIGIDPEKVDLLFEPFVQADASVTRRFGGTGLGLAISKQLAEMMGGEIGAQSTEGLGSTFWFTVRVGKRAAPPEEALSRRRHMAGERILVVDDNRTNRRLISVLLDSWGCEHDEAPDGVVALHKLRTAVARHRPFQLAILDMMMPGMDGETLGRQIKCDPMLAETLLLMMTSAGRRRGDRERIENIGFAGSLVKPVKQSQLYDSLVDILYKPDASGTIEGFPANPPAPQTDSTTPTPVSSARILLAEDNLTNQKVALKLMEKMGYHADVVGNGREALEALAARPYDLVLMDVQMPEMDGFEATHRIRRPESAVLSHDIPVVAMTAHAMAGDRESCLEAGMDDYVSKPIDPRVLAEVIARWLSATPTSRPRPTPIRPVAAEPPAEQTDVPTYDHDGVLERLMGDESLVREVISMFLEDTPRQMDALARALQAGDATAVRRLAHTVKGAAGNVGAQVVQAAALRLEQASESGDMKETGAARTALEQAMLEFSRLFLVDGGMAP